MQGIYKELHSPTGIETAVVCNFINSNEENIIISTANELQVYRIKEVSTDNLSESHTSQSKLECLLTFKLVEKLVSMQPIKSTGCPDYIMLGFEEAKLSLVQYDSETHDLKTISIHNYEQEELKDVKLQQTKSLPMVRCDPDSRCAAAVVNNNRLAVFPFYKNQTQTIVENSYIINLGNLNRNLTSVLDFHFLHGYFQPSVAILYEQLPTWAGRISVKKDSVTMILISIDIEQKSSHLIWSIDGLPFDAYRMLPVPQPLGGVLAMATNSLMYFNQGYLPRAVSLNSFGLATTDFSLKVQEGVELTLDCCQACFVRYDKVFLSLKNGEFHLLTLLNDNTNVVKGFDFKKITTTVITTCICMVGDEYLFLGSRLDNSRLLKFSEKHSDDNLTDNNSVGTLLDEDDMEEVELYGKHEKKSEGISQFAFQLCDTILNIGPCGQTIIGRTEGMAKEFSEVKNCDLELVTTSGFGKSGAVSVLQRSIRPEVVAPFQMLDCVDLWTLFSKEESLNEDERDETDNEDNDYYHSLMMLSGPKLTMVLRIGSKITELDQSDFNTKEPTIFAGNIGNNEYIIQVCKSGIKLLKGTKCIQNISLVEEASIVSCSLADPYLALITDLREILIVSLEKSDDGSSTKLVLNKPPNLNNVMTMSLYHDKSGLFNSHSYNDSPAEKVQYYNDVEMLDEEEYLYGTKSNESQDIRSSQASLESSHWLATYQSNGDLLIYSVPDFEVRFKSPCFGQGDDILSNSLGRTTNAPPKDVGNSKVHEILLVGMGDSKQRPHLMAIVNQELFIYEAFHYMISSPTPILQLRFKKLIHRLNYKDIQPSNKAKNVIINKRPILRQFENVSGLRGVFLTGTRPHWIFMTHRGILRLHPMVIDGSISVLSSFHNVSCCLNGFIYLNHAYDLRICRLSSNMDFDSVWPVRRISLKHTPYHLAYHIDKKLYAVTMSEFKSCNKLPKMTNDSEIETIERNGQFISPKIEYFTLQVYYPPTWEPIPNCRMEFEEFEKVTSMKVLSLKSEEGIKEYIVCGTTYCWTENVKSKGRVIVMDMIEVVPEPGVELSKNKLKVKCDSAQKGGVSAIAEVNGLLIHAIAQKINISKLSDKELKTVIVIDTQVYVHSIAVIKDFIYTADVCKSVSLYKYHENLTSLSLITRDIQRKEVYSLEYLVDRENLYFTATDSDKNLLVYSYQPDSRESMYGQNLVNPACFNIGSHVNSMFRIKCSTDNMVENSFANRQATYFSTLDGSIGCLIPIPDKMYRRLLMLQTVMTWNILHAAGLNPKAARYSNSSSKHPSIIDGVLISRFYELNESEKKHLADRIGTPVEQILSDLYDIEMTTFHF